MTTTCPGCHLPLEDLAAIRTYHAGCDPQEVADTLREVARAALQYRPAQMKGRE